MKGDLEMITKRKLFLDYLFNKKNHSKFKVNSKKSKNQNNVTLTFVRDVSLSKKFSEKEKIPIYYGNPLDKAEWIYFMGGIWKHKYKYYYEVYPIGYFVRKFTNNFMSTSDYYKFFDLFYQEYQSTGDSFLFGPTVIYYDLYKGKDGVITTFKLIDYLFSHKIYLEKVHLFNNDEELELSVKVFTSISREDYAKYLIQSKELFKIDEVSIIKD